jgi:integrase
VDFSRPKTGIARRCILWPETVSAIREVMAERPSPKNEEDEASVFLTSRGGNWHKETGGSYLSWKFGKLLRSLSIKGRSGLGFYTLRHTFRTVADEVKDQPAADFIMGHESSHMSSHYREKISDARLKAVTDHVRAWLYGSTSEPTDADSLQ